MGHGVIRSQHALVEICLFCITINNHVRTNPVDSRLENSMKEIPRKH